LLDRSDASRTSGLTNRSARADRSGDSVTLLSVPALLSARPTAVASVRSPRTSRTIVRPASVEAAAESPMLVSAPVILAAREAGVETAFSVRFAAVCCSADSIVPVDRSYRPRGGDPVVPIASAILRVLRTGAVDVVLLPALVPTPMLQSVILSAGALLVALVGLVCRLIGVAMSRLDRTITAGGDWLLVVTLDDGVGTIEAGAAFRLVSVAGLVGVRWLRIGVAIWLRVSAVERVTGVVTVDADGVLVLVARCEEVLL